MNMICLCVGKGVGASLENVPLLILGALASSHAFAFAFVPDWMAKKIWREIS